MRHSQGLLDRIKDASSPEEVHELLKQGEEFAKASDRTRKRWKRAANKKLQEFFPHR